MSLVTLTVLWKNFFSGSTKQTCGEYAVTSFEKSGEMSESPRLSFRRELKATPSMNQFRQIRFPAVLRDTDQFAIRRQQYTYNEIFLL